MQSQFRGFTLTILCGRFLKSVYEEGWIGDFCLYFLSFLFCAGFMHLPSKYHGWSSVVRTCLYEICKSWSPITLGYVAGSSKGDSHPSLHWLIYEMCSNKSQEPPLLITRVHHSRVACAINKEGALNEPDSFSSLSG